MLLKKNIDVRMRKSIEYRTAISDKQIYYKSISKSSYSEKIFIYTLSNRYDENIEYIITKYTFKNFIQGCVRKSKQITFWLNNLYR